MVLMLSMISFFFFFLYFLVGDSSMGRQIQLLLSGHTQRRRSRHEGIVSFIILSSLFLIKKLYTKDKMTYNLTVQVIPVDIFKRT